MGIKDKMMDRMMSKMTAEEKKEMMNNMMDKFFDDMTKEEKQEMMKDMMPKMMEKMMGGEGGGNPMMGMMKGMMGGEGGGSPMMGMMKGMMGGDKDGKGGGFNPMDMCKKMMSSISQSSEIATFATPEVRGLINDWAQQVNGEILSYLDGNNNVATEDIAAQLKISEESVIYFLSKLAQEKKIKIQVA